MHHMIYLRSNDWFDKYDVYKLGKTKSIWDRENSYITSEPRRGKYVMVIEVDEIDELERQLQHHFKRLNLYIDGATELFSKDIITQIVPFLKENNINYKVLSEDEINDLTRIKRDSNDDANKFVVRDYQRDIINKSIEHYKTNDNGMLVLPCGTGKTFMTLLFIQESKYTQICIVVPNLLLLKQWEDNVKLILPDISILLVSGSINKIKQFISENDKFVIITTYHSAYKLCKTSFDIIVNDECHHLTTNNITDSKKRFIRTLDINSTKKLSLTATIKCIDDKNINNLECNYISNDDIEKFGSIIDRKNLLWSIKKKIVCDYRIRVVTIDKNQLNVVIDIKGDTTLHMSAYVGLMSIADGTSKHMFMYCNSKISANRLIKNIKKIKDIYFNLLPIYYSSYNSDMKNVEQDEILNNFKNSTFGIIVCIYCLAEGFDIPLLDSVLFAEPMSSEIRIVQASLRAGRKNKLIPDKITSIILPMLYNDNLNEQFMDRDLIYKNNDFKKIREVIYQMGQEDETILQKISLSKCIVKEYKNSTLNQVSLEIADVDILESIELTALLLKNIQRNTISLGYEYAIKTIALYKLDSKESYYKLCKQKISLSAEPEELYSDKWTNWIDYLSIERKYYDLEVCKIKVTDYLKDKQCNLFDYIKITKTLKELDDMYPPYDLWCEYYNITGILELINTKKRKVLVKS